MEEKVSAQIGLLRWISSRTTIPVPRVITYDTTCKNPIESPYVVQSRLQGHNFEVAAHLLTEQQLYSFAHLFSKLVLELQKITSPTPGLVVGVKEGSNEPLIHHFKSGKQGDDKFDGKPAHSFTKVIDMIRFKIQRLNGNVPYSDEIMDELRRMARSMNKFGFFKRQPMVLCHGDLEPRNIMVDLDGNGSLHITGIVDWDLASFVPHFAACRPPVWLWRNY